MSRNLYILFMLVSLSGEIKSQDSISPPDKISIFPSRFFDKLHSKTAGLEAKLERQTENYLQRLAKRERKIKRKLARVDSAAAEQLFGDSEQQYAGLKENMLSSSLVSSKGETYQPYVDSLTTSLSFLEQNQELLGDSKDLTEKIKGSLQQVKSLQGRLQQSEQIKAFIKQRKQQIKETLSRYTKLPRGITKSYNDINKELYYYTQQVQEYRELLNNPDQLTKKVLTLLNRLDAFQRFMREHSQLAGLFGGPLLTSPGGGGTASLAGLQTRQQVQQLIQTQIAAAGPNAQQIVQQNIQAAQQQLTSLKDKINKLGGAGADMDMPDFKPNHQKTKSFWQRLEYGTNLQSTKSNAFFPTTTDVGLSVGYKLSDKSIIGIGASYKVGWGKDIRNIHITSEGMGLRSFLDIKLKGSFFISGGYEKNYQPFAVSPSPGGGQGEAWQEAGLIGLSKVVSLKSKLFKKTKLQLFWDFLSYGQVPRTQAVKFRVGYNF